MPLHDWRDDRGWESVHLPWLAQLLDWIQPRLPAGYRAYLGSVPALTIDTPNGRPDVSVRQWTPPAEPIPSASPSPENEPDMEAVATFTLDAQHAVHIDLHGQLIAAIEVVSPRNKDRPAARERYLGRYAGYLRQGIHLLLVDVLPRPAGFSFADALATSLGFEQAPCPTPCAVSYRVGGTVPEGTILALWHRAFQVGQPLSTIPLALDTQQIIVVDLEHTYREASRRAYLE
ncbi:MAG TPA: DUF4058 family protein [Gemmataceae bacterium]|nr:DUF4058 family protein [Gemmataceae bacterium]